MKDASTTNVKKLTTNNSKGPLEYQCIRCEQFKFVVLALKKMPN